MLKILGTENFSEGGTDFVKYYVDYGNGNIGSITTDINEFDHA